MYCIFQKFLDKLRPANVTPTFGPQKLHAKMFLKIRPHKEMLSYVHEFGNFHQKLQYYNERIYDWPK